MSTLKSLKLVKYTPATSQSANLTRRKKLVAKLEEQIRAVQDPDFQPVKLKWVRDEAGEDKRVEVRKRVREWWRVGESGTVTLTIRYGSKLIEFEPGKNAIELKSTAELGVGLGEGLFLEKHCFCHLATQQPVQPLRTLCDFPSAAVIKTPVKLTTPAQPQSARSVTQFVAHHGIRPASH
jgi:hypothetical protein